MSWTDDDSLGGMWDFGESISSDLITYPIRQAIRRDAARSGLDLDNPVRSMTTFMSSAVMGATMGSFLGPLGSALGGLFGYLMGMSAEYPGDYGGHERANRENAICTLRLKAFEMAIDATKAHVTDDTWYDIKHGMDNAIDWVKRNCEEPDTMTEAYNIMFDAVSNSVRDVDYDVYANFMSVYRTACTELEV